MSILNEKAQKDLTELIDGLNQTVMNVIKEDIVNKLSKDINNSKLTSIFSKKNGLDILTKDELIIFLEVIYDFSKLDSLNPSKIITEIKPKDHEYYNEDFKNEFLLNSNYSPKTLDTVKIIFSKTSEIENKFNKDIYEFNNEELEELMKSFKSKTLRSLQNYISKINKYVDYAVKKGVTSSSNVKRFVAKGKDLSKFVDEDAQENMIFSKEAIMDMAEYADNAQDGVILSLIFDGVSFKDRYAELVELTDDMVDFENGVINLPARQEGEYYIEARTIEMSNETKLLVKRAINDTKYVSINGDVSRTYNIADSKHVLRGVRAGREKINWRNVNQRILRISQINDEEFLNATTVSYSGQVHYAQKLIDKGCQMLDAVDSVLKRFGLPINSSSQFYLRSRIEKYSNKV